MFAFLFAGVVGLGVAGCTDQTTKGPTGGTNEGGSTGGSANGGNSGGSGGGNGGSTSTGGTGGSSSGGSKGGNGGGGSSGTATGGAKGGSSGGSAGGSSGGSTGGSAGGSSGGSSGGAGGAAGGSSGSTTLIGTTTFSKGAATGDLTGYGWVALGADDSLTSPTCGAAKDPITKASPCTTTTVWSKDTALCLTGSIPALSNPPLSTEYTTNWGVQVGVNSTTEPSGKLGKSFSTIAIKFSGTPTSARAVIHLAGDPAATSYCFDAIKSGDVMDLSKFNTECWSGGKGSAFSASSAANIDKVSLQISSTSSAITVTDFCMDSITLK
jgi:hypothetical protein